MKQLNQKAVNPEHYDYRISWSEEDGEYVARCVEFRSLSFLAPTHNEALRGIIKLIQSVLKDMRANGETPPEPLSETKFSGKFVLRVSPHRHRELAAEAKEQGVSLNAYVCSLL